MTVRSTELTTDQVLNAAVCRELTINCGFAEFIHVEMEDWAVAFGRGEHIYVGEDLVEAAVRANLPSVELRSNGEAVFLKRGRQ